MFLKPDDSIKVDEYCYQMDKMREKLALASSALINTSVPILLYDNAKRYVSRKMSQKLNDLSFEVLSHPAYTSELSSTLYHFFKHLDNSMKGGVFKNQIDYKNAFGEFTASEIRTSMQGDL
ncbi:hypothetical protein ANCCAN_22852 [Ancylostoma caninum]|uniref:Tc1-like transposase DDE domain-containing protein n=1 Tax=Ancylostoma caninum TaxID=29170 RepID=A0A368FGJ9_ANCCA|nr:hypothetical protein ANCCAN_22852 [Ancylostoma caninum]